MPHLLGSWERLSPDPQQTPIRSKLCDCWGRPFFVMHRCLDHRWRERIVNFGVREPSRQAVCMNSSSALPSRVPWHDKSRHPAATSNLETIHPAQSTWTTCLCKQQNLPPAEKAQAPTSMVPAMRDQSNLVLMLPSHKKLLLACCTSATTTL